MMVEQDARSVLQRLMSQGGARHDPVPSFTIGDTDISLGTSALVDDVPAFEPVMIAKPVEIVRELSPNDIYAAFLKLARSDRTYVERLAHDFEWSYPFSKAKVVEPFPLRKSSSIEIALDDKGEAKRTKNSRPLREAMRFTGRIQICTGTNKTVSKADWTGRLEFRTGTRAKKDAAKHFREGNFSAAFLEVVNNRVDQTVGSDALFGFVRADTEGQGSPHVDGFLFIAGEADMASHAPEMLIEAIDPKGRFLIDLPAFDTKTNKGSPLGGGFVMQCRASRDDREWATGTYDIAKL